MEYLVDSMEISMRQQIYSILMALARKLDKYVNDSISGLTASQFMAVLAIQQSTNEEITMISVARKLGTTKQNITQLIPVLEKKGYVTRSENPNNKRVVNLAVTDSGLNAMMSYAGASAALMSDVFDGFTEREIETLLHLLRKLHSYDGKKCPELYNFLASVCENPNALNIVA